jgi:hypothetical protein
MFLAILPEILLVLAGLVLVFDLLWAIPASAAPGLADGGRVGIHPADQPGCCPAWAESVADLGRDAPLRLVGLCFQDAVHVWSG